MTFDEVKRYFVSSYKFERKMGMSHTNFVRWGRIGCIPMESQERIEVYTKGKLVAKYKDGLERDKGKLDVDIK